MPAICFLNFISSNRELCVYVYSELGNFECPHSLSYKYPQKHDSRSPSYVEFEYTKLDYRYCTW